MDFETKAIIEFNGIKWHPRLDKYSIDEYKGISVYLKTDKKIREAHEYDMGKKRIAKDNGFSYLVIWDSDPADVNINLIEEFLNKNKIKYKYNENDKNKIIKKARPRKTNVGS
jgi:hypothetical protein